MTRDNNYIICKVSELTQEILDSSTTKNPYEMQVSAPDIFGEKYAMLRFENGKVPLAVYNIGCNMLTKDAKDLILESDTIWQTEASELISNKALNFDGVSAHVNFGNTFNYSTANSFSISIWVRPQNLSAQRCIFSKATQDTAVDGWMLYLRTDGAIYGQYRTDTGDRNQVYTETINASEWSHIMMTYSGGSNSNGISVYVNGVKDITTGSTGLSGWSKDQDFLIGRRGTSFHFSGDMREFTAWNTEISEENVELLYNNGEPIDPQGFSFSSFLESYNKLGTGDTFPNAEDSINDNHGIMTNMDTEDIIEI